MKDKLNAMIRSRRFWMTVAGLVFVVSDSLGADISQDMVNNVVLLIAGWVVGDSLRTTK